MFNRLVHWTAGPIACDTLHPPTLSSSMAWRTEAKLCKSQSTVTLVALFFPGGWSGTAIVSTVALYVIVRGQHGELLDVERPTWFRKIMGIQSENQYCKKRIEDGRRVDEFVLKWSFRCHAGLAKRNQTQMDLPNVCKSLPTTGFKQPRIAGEPAWEMVLVRLNMFYAISFLHCFHFTSIQCHFI